MIKLFFLSLFIFFALTLSINAQKLTLTSTFAKKTVVVPKFSVKLVDFQKVSAWSGRSTYFTRIDRQDGIYAVLGRSDWKDSGWSIMEEFWVEKIGKDDGKNIIEFRNTSANLKIELGSSITNLDEALNEFFFVGNLYSYKKSDFYKKEVINKHLPKIFKGKLESLDEDFKLKLLEAVKFNSEAIAGEDFKGKFYLSLNVGSDDVFYNTIQVNQSERVARTVERVLNAGLKQFAELEKYKEIEGIKLIISVGYADFIREGQYPAHSDEIQLYFLFENLKAYQNADITNQQLLDKSYVLVNGNRVQVSLTQFN